jgi:hypothetical protein
VSDDAEEGDGEVAIRERHVHGFPSVGAEEEVDHVVFLLRLAAQVAVYHLADRCCSVYSTCISHTARTLVHLLPARAVRYTYQGSA